MTMQILPAMPDELKMRVHERNMIPVRCDCGVAIAWARWRGDNVTCPECGAKATLQITSAPATAIVTHDDLPMSSVQDVKKNPAEASQ